MSKKKRQIPSPRFGGGILADSTTVADSGKLNVQGIFTLFWAWDFPCERRGAAIITLFDLPKGKTRISVSIRKKGSKAKHLTPISVDYKKEEIPPLISRAMSFPLTSAGPHELVFSIPRVHKILRVPFEVRKKAWPQFTQAEVEFAKTSPNTVKSMRANIQCAKCSHAYVFEETLLDTPPDGGVFRFPESGRFNCVECKHTLRLRDFQGQLRAALKKQIEQAMGKKL